MKSRSERLQVVLGLEQRKEDAALDRLSRARDHLQREQQRLDELSQYQSDYREQMRRAQQGVVSVARLQGWQAFIAQLDDVIRQQEGQVVHAQRGFEVARDDWRQAYERKQGMSRHVEACRQVEQREGDQREQKQLDEAASRLHARRRQGRGS